MVRFAEYLNGSTATEEKLRSFLREHTEWVRLEFKESKQVPIHGLRISVAALASTSGGDLFLGVKDDGTFEGCAFDPSAISKVLEQEGAPAREGAWTNQVEVIRDPVKIDLANGNRVYWLDVPEFGWVVGALKDDGTIGLYDRPGANSTEAVGLAAVDLFLRTNRARLLRRVYEEAELIANRFQWVYQGPGKVNDDMLDPLRRLVRSPEWDRYARRAEREWVRDDLYLALILRLPTRYEAWEKMDFHQITQRQPEMLEVKNGMQEAVRRIKEYLQRERVLPLS